jgi:hypothetical protein
MTLAFLALAALQVADVYLTWRILGAGGSERNPLMRRWLVAVGTLPGLLLAKAVLLVLAWVYLRELPLVLLALAAAYALVVLHNLKQLRPS